jgi:formylglycine-generating enzyme required for sulfatase activity/uncharacterized caspase-like protein
MGKNWAIVVGINNYDNLQTLKYAKGDAEAVATWFREEARFDQVFLFTEDSRPIPTNPPIPTQPSYGRFRRFLNAQFETPLLKPEDNLWFFFAGHGKRYVDQDYLMFLDSDPTDSTTAICVDYVTQRLRRCGADNVVLLLDACRDEGSRSGLGIGIEEHQGVITFYSCAANQQSWEIDELQHGSFTYALLEGLRLQGETNCATVERLDQYLRYHVPQLNTRYRKAIQNPYLKAEPPYKMYFVLLEQTARLKDVEPLKFQASLAENEGNLLLAEQLWIRVLAVSRGDWDAIKAIKRIALRQRANAEFISLNPEPITSSPSGERSATSQSAPSDTTQESQLAQRQEEHQQNLVRYQQAFSEAIEREFPLSVATRNKLQQLQQSLQLSNNEISQIEQPILAKKDAENRKRQQEEKIRQQAAERLKQQEAEKIRQQQEAERLKQEEADKRRQQPQVVTPPQATTSKPSTPQRATTITTSVRINRKQFLQWVGLGSASLVTAVVGREIFKGKSSTISVPEPKYIPPAEGAPKLLGLPMWKVQFETVTVDNQGQVIKRDSNKQAKFFKEDLGNGITLEMVEIPAGSFKMGSPPEEKGRSKDEEPQHTVNAPTFFMGMFEVTQEQYQQLMGKNPSRFKGAKRPVETVSWNDAVEFCKKLSQKTKRNYRLPSEAEWEYACRAGTTTPFYFGETITTDLANYKGNYYIYASAPKGKYREQTTEVGSFPPNAFGLYDMHGNVWEWCQDTWHDSYKGAPTDGRAWVDNDNQLRLLRGGSWNYSPGYCRSALRYRYSPDLDYYSIGFRVVCGVAARTL